MPGVHRKAVAGQVDCGPNYLLPDDTARLGSHTFVILGRDGPEHIWAAHRSGTPPHNFQFVWRVRLDPDELAFYEQVVARSSTLPAFTTIQYAGGQQVERTFFCLHDLPEMVGDGARPGDRFEGLFPIRAALLGNAQHEAIFEIGKNVVGGGELVLERADIELVLHRYLPAYVDPDDLRRNVAAHPELRERFDHAPVHPAESVETAQRKAVWPLAMVGPSEDRSCPRNFKLPGAPVEKTTHSFLLLGEVPDGRTLAVHLYAPAPHNFQTFLLLALDEAERATVAAAQEKEGLVVLHTQVVAPEGPVDHAFCLSSLRTDLAEKGMSLAGGASEPGAGQLARPEASGGGALKLRSSRWRR